MNKKISFQGVEGAYSHLAVQEFFPGAEPLPCKTFEIALNEAELGNVDSVSYTHLTLPTICSV